MVRQIPKISEKNNESALKQAIKNKVDYFKDYDIKDNILYITLNVTFNNKTNHRDITSYPRLPYYKEIEDEARRIYKNFRRDDIVKVCYIFRNEIFDSQINISPGYSDVKFIDCDIRALRIYGGETIEIIDTGNGLIGNQYFDIECIKLKLKNVKAGEYGRINIIADEISVEDSILNSVSTVNITSSMITFSNSILDGTNIELKCDLIDTKDTIFKANIEFNIKCKYNEEVKGVEAEKIVYNGKDITNSDSVVRPKLIRNLVEDLKKVKRMINADIKKDVEETARIKRETLEEKPITKILNKNNK